MRRDHLDAVPPQLLVQRIAVIGAIADQVLRLGLDHVERVMIFAGGVPLTVDGKIVGAVGVSGGSGEQDQAVAEAAAAVCK